MRPDGIVLAPPNFNQNLGLLQRLENLGGWTKFGPKFPSATCYKVMFASLNTT